MLKDGDGDAVGLGVAGSLVWVNPNTMGAPQAPFAPFPPGYAKARRAEWVTNLAGDRTGTRSSTVDRTIRVSGANAAKASRVPGTGVSQTALQCDPQGRTV